MARSRTTRPAVTTTRQRPRDWFDDPLIETEQKPSESPALRGELPTVPDHHASTILYDAQERPIRRRIGFRGGARD